MESGHLEDLWIDGKERGCELDSYGSMVGTSELDNELSGSIKCWEFLK
jgi:hypothetical protein